MSLTTITKRHYIDGVLKDATSFVLSDPDGNFGVKIKGGANVVADGTAMVKIATGVYQYSFEDPAYDLTYEYWIESVYSGVTTQLEFEISGTKTPVTVGMTLDEMIDLVRIKMERFLENLDYGLTFTPQKAVLFLNKAQRRAVTLIRRHFRHELDNDFTEQALDSDDGHFDLTTLSPPLFGVYIGIDKIRLTDGKFCTKKSLDEIREIRNAYRTPSTSKPIYHIRGSKIYVEPYASQTIDIYGYRRPVDMVLDSVDCELGEGLQDVIIEIAVSLWLDSIGEGDLADKCKVKYFERIGEIHSTMAPTDSILHDSDIEESWDPMDDEKRIEYWAI